MVSGFRRSVSLPKPARPEPVREKSYHVRSTSLPTRSHPVLCQLKDQVQTVRSWVSAPDQPTTALISYSLDRLKQVHDSVDDLLQLNEPCATLRRHPELVDELLEGFLRYVDALGILRSGLVGLRESVQEAQVGARTGRWKNSNSDPVRTYVKCLKKLAKEMAPALSMVRETEKRSQVRIYTVEKEEEEVVDALREAGSVTAAVVEAVFLSFSVCSSSWMGMRRKKSGEVIRELVEVSEVKGSGRSEEKVAVLRRLQAVEECVEEIEKESERVFRSLICTRVSLLNVLTTR